ncbi:MAG: hypothetical protein HFP81_00550 [Methylococcales symbiont of Hymedesmia sp. n. MRB-2018]|nr:MAG: hypothetical protein HFP81_00550 [Methylococcales symbiont of Hymedesmia sp. n. MRB-2018]
MEGNFFEKITRCISNTNKNQKIALLVTLAICLILLALHNPFGGYTTLKCTVNPYSATNCYDIGFWYYKSKFAVFGWLKEIGRFVGFIVPVLLFGAIATIVLCSKNDSNE